MEPVTVTELNEKIKLLIDNSSQFKAVSVKGEISNCTVHTATGHIYLTLKDAASLIKVVMFKREATALDFKPENGMKVVINGRVSIFVRDGIYVLYAHTMKREGTGTLFEQYMMLKERLEKEGLFDQRHKKPLPRYPRRVGIATSPTGAAIRDMLDVSKRRFPLTEIVIYPCLVQGSGAANSVISAIRYFNDVSDVDVIIFGRGGGSLEDLWAFNDEALARAIFSSRIPTVSAVGHETDFSISDFVADVRAATPSVAAEIVFPDGAELKRRLGNVSARIRSHASSRISQSRRLVSAYSSSRCLREPRSYIDDRRLYVANLSERLTLFISRPFERSRALLSSKSGRLEMLNPLSVLSRGYAAVFTDDGAVTKSADALAVGDKIKVRFADGAVGAAVETKFTKGQLDND